MPCVYIIKSKSNGKLYVGSSRESGAETRLAAHNSGKTKSTKNGRPWELLLTKQHPTYREARKRELFLKSGVGRNWIKNNVKI